MKRKYITLIFLTLILFGCETTDEPTMDNTDITTSEIPVQKVSETQELSIDDSSKTEEPLEAQTFGISSKEIALIIYNKEVDFYSKNIGNYNVDIFPNENYLLFCVTLNKDEFPSLIYAYDQSKPGTDKSANLLIQTFLNNFSTDANIQHASCDVGKDLRNIVSCLYIKNSKVKNFPLTIKLAPETDYFLSVDTEDYKAACNEGRYNDILLNVQTYIDSTSPPSYDNAYTLLSVLTPIVDHWNNIEIEYDSIEKVATFTYTGINEINNTTHFVPYASTNEKNIHSLIGFYDSDWLFFKDIIISSNENINISISYNKSEEVTDGGQIYEAYDTSLDDDTIKELLSSSTHTIRFIAKDDSFKDYEMSDEEYEAFVAIAKFQNVPNILSDLLFHFQNRQSK